ncbi:AIPR family protein [Cystobacter fuscus]
MSSLKVNQIRNRLKALFESHLELKDISQTDSERENKVLSRCLAAFAIYHLAGCSEQAAAQSVTDGADDNGLDAVYYDSTDKSILVVQSKWINKGAGEPEAKDIGTFLDGVKDLVEQNIDNFHPRLSAVLDDVCLKLNTPGTSVRLVVATTGASSLAKHSTTKINKFLKELNGDETDKIASSAVLGLSEVYSGLASDSRHKSVGLNVTIENWSHIHEPHPAYYGTVDGQQLKAWWVDHGKHILAANIRHALGDTEVNTQIKLTATQNPDRFWYFNNGITLIAEEIAKAPANTASRSFYYSWTFLSGQRNGPPPCCRNKLPSSVWREPMTRTSSPLR